jgi:polyisoprenyl-phosphate glycosyltransferase
MTKTMTKNESQNSLGIVIPVYNDWDSFTILVGQINKILQDSKFIDKLTIVGIDDGSDKYPKDDSVFGKNVEIVHLSTNIGHQKAIAIGLAYIAREKPHDYTVVMDSDGQDKPEHILNLLKECADKSNMVVFAQRIKRSEGLLFRTFYFAYKVLYRILTNNKISFGNFSIIPLILLPKVVGIPEIWNHYSSGIVKSKIPYKTIPLERGERIIGTSKMNINTLVLHGLSAVSVQIDVVSVRILIACLLAMFIAANGILFTAVIRLFTDIYVPGWATYVVLSLMILLTQAFLVSLILVFIILSYRSQKLFIPSIDYRDYILNVGKFNI